ncbi:MAG: YhbY family RNA-binding protein [Deferribacteres bacterium]|nr:YhbY family RNA-binding protein [candidate division KSB1 bacterium]MCB9500506.1 YhbY family RNA-binding protein [Deferribacteres bacterium]
MSELSGKQKRYLRGLGNQVKSTVFIGQNGITESVIQSINEAFQTSELVKIRLQDGYLDNRKKAGDILAEAAASELVQVIGRTILLYKQNDEEPEIVLPD